MAGLGDRKEPEATQQPPNPIGSTRCMHASGSRSPHDSAHSQSDDTNLNRTDPSPLAKASLQAARKALPTRQRSWQHWTWTQTWTVSPAPPLSVPLCHAPRVTSITQYDSHPHHATMMTIPYLCSPLYPLLTRSIQETNMHTPQTRKLRPRIEIQPCKACPEHPPGWPPPDCSPLSSLWPDLSPHMLPITPGYAQATPTAPPRPHHPCEDPYTILTPRSETSMHHNPACTDHYPKLQRSKIPHKASHEHPPTWPSPDNSQGSSPTSPIPQSVHHNQPTISETNLDTNTTWLSALCSAQISDQIHRTKKPALKPQLKPIINPAYPKSHISKAPQSTCDPPTTLAGTTSMSTLRTLCSLGACRVETSNTHDTSLGDFSPNAECFLPFPLNEMKELAPAYIAQAARNTYRRQTSPLQTQQEG